MKPYYEDKWVTIYHGDCREILPQLPDSSVDLVVTDPPYNVGKDYGVYKDKLKKAEYQAMIDWLLVETRRLASGNLVVVLGSYSNILLDWWIKLPDAKLIIIKMGAWSRNRIKNLALQYHCVLTTVPSNKLMTDLWEDIRWPGEGYFYNEARYGHPAMTPEKLARRLISLFSPDNGLIVDPFLGVGTIAVASKYLGRKCIGIEIEEKYCEISANRCRQMVMEF